MVSTHQLAVREKHKTTVGSGDAASPALHAEANPSLRQKSATHFDGRLHMNNNDAVAGPSGTSHERIYQCRLCKHIPMPNAHVLEWHLNTFHEGQRQYRCRGRGHDCERETFLTEEDLEKHIIGLHLGTRIRARGRCVRCNATGDPPPARHVCLRCPYCRTNFRTTRSKEKSDRENLERHVYDTHPGQPFNDPAYILKDTQASKRRDFVKLILVWTDWDPVQSAWKYPHIRLEDIATDIKGNQWVPRANMSVFIKYRCNVEDCDLRTLMPRDNMSKHFLTHYPQYRPAYSCPYNDGRKNANRTRILEHIRKDHASDSLRQCIECDMPPVDFKWFSEQERQDHVQQCVPQEGWHRGWEPARPIKTEAKNPVTQEWLEEQLDKCRVEVPKETEQE